ncbi:MAG: DNA-3-methyladenine glycosylase 2 family protein [Cellulosilyticum sp.]|nr:DNA-3-methyladenine glycosylase 2 family protein [Cellulosilyticum sp.]
MSNIVMLDHLNHFDITQILESGQVFRFEKISDHSYLLNAKQKLIKITQQPDSSSAIIYNTNISELDEVWIPYFDIDTDYDKIASKLAQKDSHMAKAIDFGKGIRILHQDPWEMLISFIISQNKSIPHIKQCISNISKGFGDCLEQINGDDQHYYAFPTPEQLSKATEEELRDCKVGFRAPYIMDACQKVLNGEVILNELFILSVEEARERLMTIKGVGPKIADCILLFAYGKGEVFPTDVWIKRVVEGLYFEGKEVKPAEIQAFAKSYFGKLAGYAQQYLFYYGRENALFK